MWKPQWCTREVKRSHSGGNLLQCARFCLLVLLAVSMLQHSCVTSYRVSGNSMVPSFLDGDRVVVAKMPEFLGDPQRGDTVIVRVRGEILIKRVVAIPGDVIEIGGGRVIDNGEVIEDPVPPAYRACDDMRPLVLDRDEYFLLGDHRRVSIDSRDFGPVHRSDIIGRVILRVPRDENDR